ncbi:C-C motif chemokine 1 [Sturnira hondurensis]|uniref:C-C motif chemokine 1 n=1 Tax=Sturnira hondurensis TaxID=192404 RepID=UPI001879E291|nr:C-C motif chemokine 1 [Sturnira hondurensis]
MKLIIMALACLLVAGMWLQDVNSKSLLVRHPRCCFKFMKKSILLDNIQCYRNSSSSCSHREVVIFRMNRGKERCASNQKQWVKDYLPKLMSCMQ